MKDVVIFDFGLLFVAVVIDVVVVAVVAFAGEGRGGRRERRGTKFGMMTCILHVGRNVVFLRNYFGGTNKFGCVSG